MLNGSTKKTISDLKIGITDTVEKDITDTDITVDTEDKIRVDVNKIKNILNNRLKTYQEDHIHKLIDEYELSNKEYISKTTMTELLNKAIHI